MIERVRESGSESGPEKTITEIREVLREIMRAPQYAACDRLRAADALARLEGLGPLFGDDR